MLSSYHHTVTEKFLRYVQIDTQSNPQSTAHPSTEKQKDLSVLLAKELLEIGWNSCIHITILISVCICQSNFK